MTKYRAENQVRGAVDGMVFDSWGEANDRAEQLNSVETSGTWWVETIEESTTNTNNYSAGSSEGGSGLLWLIIILIIYALLGGK